MSENAAAVQAAPHADPLVWSDDRQERLRARWTRARAMTSAVARAVDVAAAFGATCLAPSSPEATAWAVLVSNRSGLRLVQPGLTAVTGDRVLVLEPVLLTGSAVARTAAVLLRQGAKALAVVVGEAPYLAPDLDVLAVEDVHVLRTG